MTTLSRPGVRCCSWSSVKATDEGRAAVLHLPRQPTFENLGLVALGPRPRISRSRALARLAVDRPRVVAAPPVHSPGPARTTRRTVPMLGRAPAIPQSDSCTVARTALRVREELTLSCPPRRPLMLRTTAAAVCGGEGTKG